MVTGQFVSLTSLEYVCVIVVTITIAFNCYWRVVLVSSFQTVIVVTRGEQ